MRVKDLDELAVECLTLALEREPTSAELLELRRPKSPSELEEMALELRQAADSLRKPLDIDPEEELTVVLPLSYGSAASYVAVIERGARREGVACQTRILKTGLFSKRVYFTFRARRLRLSLFRESFEAWAQASGIRTV
jgi:hypothetical protein